MGVCLDGTDWKDSAVSRWGVCFSPRSRDAREECALFKLGNTGCCPTQGANGGIRRWEGRSKRMSRGWASIGQQKIRVNRSQNLWRRLEKEEKMEQKSCTAVLLVDLTFRTRLPHVEVFGCLSVEKESKARGVHVKSTSSTLWATLSQVSAALSPLPPNKNLINLEIFFSGQFQMFLLESLELSKILREDQTF